MLADRERLPQTHGEVHCPRAAQESHARVSEATDGSRLGSRISPHAAVELIRANGLSRTDKRAFVDPGIAVLIGRDAGADAIEPLGAVESGAGAGWVADPVSVARRRSEEHTSELQSPDHLVC